MTGDPHGEGGPPRRFRLPANRRRVQALVDQELRFHLEERIEGLIAGGMTRQQAEAEVQQRFGDFGRYREEVRGIDEQIVRRRDWLDVFDGLRRGVRLGVRTLLRTPGFTALAIITLGLGIGATTAIYAVLDAVVLRPLPYAAPEELVAFKHPAEVPGMGVTKWALSAAGYHHVQRETRVLSDIGAFSTFETTLVGEGDAQRIPGASVTASLVRVLGLSATIGRSLHPADDVPGAEPVAMLGFDAWKTRFGGDTAVVGRMVDFGGFKTRVIGVMRQGAVLPYVDVGARSAGGALRRVDVWVPMRLDPKAPAINAHYLLVVGRLKPDMTTAAAMAEFSGFTARFPELYPSAYSEPFMREYHFGSAVTPLRDDVVGSIRQVVWIVLGAVLVVFLIAATNVANLFLVRTEVRRRETGIRSALGAGRRQLAMHYLSESLLLALAGGALGLLLARFGLSALIALAPAGLPRFDEVRVGTGTLLLGLGMAVTCGVAFGLFPLSGRVHDVMALKDGGRGVSISRSRGRLRGALVIGQVALALVLLASAGLMVRSMLQLHAVRPGFDPEGVLAVDVTLSRSGYRTYDDVERFHRALHDRLTGLPGVQSVGFGSDIPLDGFGGCANIYVEGRVYDADAEPPCVANLITGPGYFSALGMPVRGREPSWSDLDGQTGAVVVSRALADRLWPGIEPIGQGLRPNGMGPAFFRVIGVIDELHGESLETPASEVVFYPIKPIPGTMLWQPLYSATFVLRSTLANPSEHTASIRRIISELDPSVPLANVRTMESVVRNSTARARFIMTLLGTAASMALVLSAVGLYGVISYVVAQRRSEIGVRMALGARVAQVSGRVVRESLRLAVAGVVLGIAASLMVNRLLSALLFRTSPYDAVTLAGVSLLLIAIAAVASAVPARRAARVDPIEVLRDG